MPDFQRAEVTEKVFNDGRIVLAILVSKGWQDRLMDCVEHEALDHALPFDIALAKSAMGTYGLEFAMDAQWEFLPRQFLTSSNMHHLVLRDEEILPFKVERKIGEGSFAEVYEVSLPATMQACYPISREDVTLVKKTLHTSRMSSPKALGLLEREKECLRILGYMRHPNVVHFLASFTHLGRQHLLFPRYEMDLAKIFTLTDRPGYFKNISRIYLGLQGVTSALEMVHNCSLQRYDGDKGPKRIGYHHDIRPENILVDSETFLLADFGFACLKDENEASQTRWKAGLGDYVGPECLDGNDLKQQHVGRALDIWSLGCLFYEVAAYIDECSEGVERFRQLRRGNAFRPNMKDGYFFTGQSIRLSVASWASDITKSTKSPELQNLLRLAGDMLAVDPGSRPKTKDVRKTLSFICVRALLNDVLSTLNVTPQLTDQKLESRRPPVSPLLLCRLKAWAESLGLLGTNPPPDYLEIISDNYDRFCKILIHMLEGAQRGKTPAAAEGLDVEGTAVDEEFCGSLDILCHSIPWQLQERVRSSWIQDSIAIQVSKSSKAPWQHADIEIFTRMREGSVHLAEDSDKQADAQEILEPMFIPFESLNKRTILRDWLVAYNRGEDRVLVESIPQGEKWRSMTTADQQQRMRRKASILRYCSRHEEFLSLECLGYTGIPEPGSTRYGSYGFVFAFPAHTYGGDFTPITLHEIIRNRNLVEVPLGERFKLAYKIANSIKELHMAGWVHKSICSRSLLFFVNPNLKASISLPNIMSRPYLVDFCSSRPIVDTSYTETQSSEKDRVIANYSLHPDYATRARFFRASDDYYALGLLLLELGSWSTLNVFVDQFTQKSGSMTSNPEAFRQMLVYKYVPRLSHLMGESYSKAVMACLEGGFHHAADGKWKDLLDLEGYQDYVVGILGEVARSKI